MKDHQDTDEFLALRYPKIKGARLVLEELNETLSLFEMKNGGNAESLIRWSDGYAQWIHWNFRGFIRGMLSRKRT